MIDQPACGLKAGGLKAKINEFALALSEVPGFKRRTIRRRSAMSIAGVPLYDVAYGPNPTQGETVGTAYGIIAVGDIATGVLAIGCFARGFIAAGGVAVGAVTLGSISIGAFAAVGGLAIGFLAAGGLAIGLVAIGGVAAGHYVLGAGTYGTYVLCLAEQHPEAIRFFSQWIPAVERLASGTSRWPTFSTAAPSLARSISRYAVASG